MQEKVRYCNNVPLSLKSGGTNVIDTRPIGCGAVVGAVFRPFFVSHVSGCTYVSVKALIFSHVTVLK